jgi:fibronectin-binding autotransporter adhesin
LIHGGNGPSTGNYGYAAGQGGAGLTIASSANFTNSGQIIGGDGGDGGPKSGEYGASAGGGAILRGATVTNSGVIEAGRGGYNAAGVAGATLYGAKLMNSGTVIGGYGGQGGEAGGTGVIAGSVGATQSHINNSGHIIGGTGGYGYSGGTGGIGLQISATSVLNTGHILGGTGGAALHYGGNGGVGVDIIGGTLTNDGVIKGGVGGPSRYNYSGGSGVGVRMEGGTLINAGTIATSAVYGAAVYISRMAVGTVVVEPGAVFTGYVDAYRPRNDVLEMAGVGKQSFAGIGTQIYGFNIIDFAAGAKWKISGTAAGLTNGQHIDGFVAGDAIKITNAVVASGTVSVKTAGVLTVTGAGGSFTIDVDGAKVGATNFQFANDTLTKTMGAPAMAFIAPPAGAVEAERSLPPLAVSFLVDHGAEPLLSGPHAGVALAQWAEADVGGVQDVLTTPHQLTAMVVTLQAG